MGYIEVKTISTDVAYIKKSLLYNIAFCPHNLVVDVLFRLVFIRQDRGQDKKIN